MAKLLFIGTHGVDDPTRAAFPFILANGAIEAGHQPQIALMGDAVLLMKDVIAQNCIPVGWPNVKELIGQAVKNKVDICI